MSKPSLLGDNGDRAVGLRGFLLARAGLVDFVLHKGLLCKSCGKDAYQVRHPVLTLGLLALVRFLVTDGWLPCGDMVAAGEVPLVWWLESRYTRLRRTGTRRIWPPSDWGPARGKGVEGGFYRVHSVH